MSLASNAAEVSTHVYLASRIRCKRDILKVIAIEFDELFRGLCGDGQGPWRVEQLSGLDADALRSRFFTPKYRDLGEWVYSPVPSELNRL